MMSNDLEAALEYVRQEISYHVDYGPFDERDEDIKELRRIEVLLMKLKRLEEEAGV